MEMLAIAGIVLTTMFFSYFAGYAAGVNENRKRHDATRCSCGKVLFKRISARTQDMHHRVPPEVCQPIRETLRGDL